MVIACYCHASYKIFWYLNLLEHLQIVKYMFPDRCLFKSYSAFNFMVLSRPVVFDSDGTLVDSLPAHILFCKDMSKRFNLGLKIPDISDIEACRAVIDTPMDKFLRKAGFPEEKISQVFEIYKAEFCKDDRYGATLFPGMQELLERLNREDCPLGIISANYLANIGKAVGELNMWFFEFVADNEKLKGKYGSSKGTALSDSVNRFGDISPERVIYVGDREEDYKAAVTAGTSFVGAAYGWGIKSDDRRFLTANNAAELERILFSDEDLVPR